jgi:mannosyltransferase OCH1-like enzyme
MSEFRKLMINNVNDSQIWDMLEKNYDNHYTKTNIPKIIHQVWLGGAIPDKYKRLRDTWTEKNPDWQYKLWTDEDVYKFGLENIDQFNKINNLGAKSDIFRYEILYHQGGLYIDTDFECLKSFDDLLHLDFFAGTGHVNEPEVFNGLIACKPKHNLIKTLIDDIKVVSTNNFDEIIALTGPKYFSSKLFEYIENNPAEKIVIFPTTYFYPFPAVHRHEVRIDNLASRIIVNKYITEESYCTHLWYTSWQK